jgi:hypothetical protein
MTSTQDAQLGFAVEGTFKTYQTPTRFLEYVDENLDFNPNRVQGKGLRVSKRVDRSARRVTPTADANGDFTVEWASKGLGLLLQACLGSGASTLVSGATYQQVFTIGDNPSTLTVQKGMPEGTVAAAIDPISFLGCAVSQFEIDFPNADIVQIKPTLDIADVSTSQGLATATYPSEPVNLFQFAGGSISTGTLTAPTTIALGSAATPLTNVRGGSLTVNNNVRNDRFNLGMAGRKKQQLTGKRDIALTLDVEYDSTTMRDAFLGDTPLCVVLTFTAGALSTGLETVQLIVPEVKPNGELPKTNGTDLIVQSMSFTGLDNQTAAQPIWIVTRTADTTL